MLVHRWQKDRLTHDSPFRQFLNDDLRMRKALERLAYEAHRGGHRSESADLDRYAIIKILDQPDYFGNLHTVEYFLDYIDQRAGMLVGRGGEAGKPSTYGFPHRTFQEYLAGCHVINQRDARRQLWQLAAEGDYWDLTVLLGAEDLRYTRRNVNTLLELAYALYPERGTNSVERERRALLWSAGIAALLGRDEFARDSGAGADGPGYLARLDARITQLLAADRPVQERVEIGRVLGKLGDPRPGVGLRADAPLPDIAWCVIPAGSFTMGSGEEDVANSSERPQHLCPLDYSYRIARYPVTNAQYQAFITAGGYLDEQWWMPEGWQWRNENDIISPRNYGTSFSLPNHPVVGVSWYEAMAFTCWLTVQYLGKGIIAEGEVIDLPSEAEWEKAARGTDARLFPWGAEWDINRANSGKSGINSTSAVGCFPGGQSPYGVEEMSGNVLEWTRSLHRPYPYRVANDEHEFNGEDEGRVLRGGSWDLVNPGSFRCAFRTWSSLGDRLNVIGFRCMLVSPGP